MIIKLVNLNFWWGGKRLDNIIDFLRRENPDIITGQEVMNGAKDNLPKNLKTIIILKTHLNLPFYSFSPAFYIKRKSEKIDCGNLVMAKFPVKTVGTIFYDILYRRRRTVLVKKILTANDINEFINTPRNLLMTEIIINRQAYSIYTTQGIWDQHGRDNPRRLAMSQKIIRAIANKKNLILTGDFNINEGTQSIANIEKRLRSVFKGELTSTFNMKHKTDPGYSRAVVDMIFVSPTIKVVEHSCPLVDVSDHLPLIIKFEV